MLIVRDRLLTCLTGSQAVEEDVRAISQAFELLERASELFNQEPSSDLCEAEVCQKDVRSSSGNFFGISILDEVCLLRFQTSKLVTWRP